MLVMWLLQAIYQIKQISNRPVFLILSPHRTTDLQYKNKIILNFYFRELMNLYHFTNPIPCGPRPF